MSRPRGGAPRPTPPAERPATLHPRNRHQGRYDFPALIAESPALAAHVILNPYGKPSIDFADPEAVKVFNRALLKRFYGIAHWDIPPGYLCPPIPGRADYLHGLADLLAEDRQAGATAAGHPARSLEATIPRGPAVRVLDIGVGANCIYPLIGHCEYGWRFVGADIDPQALDSARAIVAGNPGLDGAIELRRQAEPRHLFKGLLETGERFDLSLCNPPFHASLDEATRGSQRKWRNLGKLDPRRRLPLLNFGGQGAELWCVGGEAGFLQRMIDESVAYPTQVLWFSSLVSKAGNLPGVLARLRAAKAREVRTLDMAQGQKQSRFVAWTFLDAEQRHAWHAARQAL
ncbi:23S rRNA (adenine(1618)-N(6))-methyltransferase RlmF [Pseudomonas sp. RIT-PI-AD]|uniref:23S rRNA (adenine(1618)-N(6))-methyltransferase RlmF n=1 Tax=Pseudomonas sp. RIT-PI-AD TaxID=3035294 RepID=UPI0021D8CF20|nr:23S rRNA (adenine(1618)-N(6))-methyltransferase RlmF [Pseudomonas sp. RIT-PI-AD]